MLFYKLSFGILLLLTLNIVSANDDDNIEDSISPCLQFAQTCVDFCMERDNVKSFSTSCALDASSCKCNGEELTSKVFKNMVELYDNINPNEMRLQVEEKDANVAPMRMLNLVLEDDVQYDEMIQDDEDASQLPKVNSNEEILEEIKKKERLSSSENNDEDEEEDNMGDMYLEYDELEYDELEYDELEYDELEYDEREEQVLEEDQGEAGIFCPSFIRRCQEDCPAAPSRPSCAVPESGFGYLLVCDCNGVDISSSVRNQVLAEVFHSPA